MSRRNRFRYVAPSPLNALVYGILGAVALAFVHTSGAATWAAITHHLGGRGAVIGGGFAFYMTWFWAVAGLYHLADMHGWWEAYRIQQRPDTVPQRRGPALGKAVRVVLRNQLLGTLPVLVAFCFLLELRGVDLTAPPDTWTTILWHLGVAVLAEEVLFYAVHRTMHRPALFRRYHRIHHEFRETIGIATHYVHYVEHLLGNLLPVFAGVLLVGAHPVTVLLWVALAVTNAIHTHAGFALPWMSWGVDHDWHHHNIRDCYGAIGLLDRVLGTDTSLRKVAEEARG